MYCIIKFKINFLITILKSSLVGILVIQNFIGYKKL